MRTILPGVRNYFPGMRTGDAGSPASPVRSREHTGQPVRVSG